MPRTKRISFPNAWYHVFNRANGRKLLFFSEYHYSYFLSLLENTIKLYGCEIHAYCLLKNHFHILVKTPHANISEIMWYIGLYFSKTVNNSLNADGPVFKNRFRSPVIDTDAYLLQVSRYIHLNPVNAGYTDTPENYKWSSLPQYYNLKKYKEYALEGLSTQTVLTYGRNIEDYKDFLDKGVDKEIKGFYKNLRQPNILGSKTFKEKIKTLT